MKENMLAASVSLKMLSPVFNSTWLAPNIGSLKLNVDATYFPATREASLGIVVHDHLRVVHICATTRVDNIESPLHVELKAILFGLKEVTSIHLPFLIIENDSLLAVREIEKQ